MPAFDKEFAAAQGKPVAYQGKNLLRLDRLPTAGVMKLRLVFESVNAKWRQGVRLKCAGTFRINGQNIPGTGGFVLWRDTAPDSVDVELIDGAPTVTVYNVWDTGDGTIHSWHNGAAMIVEELSDGRRYRCNDGEPDDDFDDLIFRLECAQ